MGQRSAAGKYSSAASRWAGVGPYYAMFPAEFAARVIKKHSVRGDWIIDPFVGRGTSTFAAAIQGRHALGIELNPVGWVYAKTKLQPADPIEVVARSEDLGRKAGWYWRAADNLPKFFKHCFCADVRAFLMAARARLDWRRDSVDRTVMAFLLVNLHGKWGQALSNQLRQTKSMSPEYAIAWWKEHNLVPPEVDPVAFLEKRVKWRYAKGVPETTSSHVYLGDSVHKLVDIHRNRTPLPATGATLLLTSPPYYAKTNYHYGQWLRLWLLGGQPNAGRVEGKYRDKFVHKERYRELLLKVFTKCKELLAKDATIYVRTGKEKITLSTTISVLQGTFPDHHMMKHCRPFRGPTQTMLFGDKEFKEGEVDLILTCRGMK